MQALAHYSLYWTDYGLLSHGSSILTTQLAAGKPRTRQRTPQQGHRREGTAQLPRDAVRAQAAPRHSPSSVSCQTMPSRLTLVPGSQGPRHSGSVARATSQVFTPTERVRTMICSHGDEMSLLTTGTRRCKGNTAGVETGDSICGEKEKCGHCQEYSW